MLNWPSQAQQTSLLQIFSISLTLLSLASEGVAFFLRGHGESGEMLGYLCLGATLIALGLVGPRMLQKTALPWWTGQLMLVFLASGYHQRFELWMPLAALAAGVIMLQRNLLSGVTVFLVGIMACRSLRWWQPHGDLASWLAALVVAASLVLLALDRSVAERNWRLVSGCVGAVLFAAASFRPSADFYSLSFYLGTIDLLRAGGTLLWDTPSQYGFLHLWLTALLPIQDSIIAFYISNSVSLWISAVLFYYVWQTYLTGKAGTIFSVVLTLLAVLLVPGWAPVLTGPNAFPSVGAYRFLMVYIMCFLLVSPLSSPRGQWWALSITWAVSFLWAIEVSFFCSAIFFSVLAVRCSDKHGTWKDLCLPPMASFLCMGLLLCLVYLIRLGHLPDFLSFIEYATSYANGFGALSVRTQGGISVLLWVSAILASVYIWCAQNGLRKDLAAAATSCVFATALYFVSRSHDNNVVNLVPLLFLGLGMAGIAIGPQARLNFFVMLHPLLAVVTAIVLGNTEDLAHYARSIAKIQNARRALIGHSPRVPQNLMPFLYLGGYRDGDPLTFIGAGFVAAPSADGHPRLFTPWTPATPVSMLSILPAERQTVLIQRFIERNPVKVGWVLEERVFAQMPEAKRFARRQGRKYLVINPTKVLYPILQTRYRMTVAQENPSMRLLRFEAF